MPIAHLQHFCTRVILGVALAILVVGELRAETLRFVCTGIIGRTFGLVGELEKLTGKKSVIDTEDEMKGGYVKFTWDTSSDTAEITLNAGGGSPDFRAQAPVIYRGDEQFVFVARHGVSEPYLYSVFQKAKVIMFSTHDTGAVLDRGGARSKSFWARCANM